MNRYFYHNTHRTDYHTTLLQAHLGTLLTSLLYGLLLISEPLSTKATQHYQQRIAIAQQQLRQIREYKQTQQQTNRLSPYRRQSQNQIKQLHAIMSLPITHSQLTKLEITPSHAKLAGITVSPESLDHYLVELSQITHTQWNLLSLDANPQQHYYHFNLQSSP